MKKVLSVLGGIFVVLVVLLGAFFGYVAYQGRGLDASSKAYVEESVPAVLATWSKSELLKRSSPQLLKAVAEKPEQMDLLFQKLSKLGAMKSFSDIKGDSQVFYTTKEGKVVTAAYTANATFENGAAIITIRPIQNAGRWELLLFLINSPILLQ